MLDFFYKTLLTLVLLNPDLSFFEDTVDKDQLATDQLASGETLFYTLIEKYMLTIRMLQVNRLKS